MLCVMMFVPVSVKVPMAGVKALVERLRVLLIGSMDVEVVLVLVLRKIVRLRRRRVTNDMT